MFFEINRVLFYSAVSVPLYNGQLGFEPLYHFFSEVKS